jgi:hypothetical protein
MKVGVPYRLQHQLVPIITKLRAKNFHRNIEALDKNVRFFLASDALIALPQKSIAVVRRC